jgi:hypothetical protein
VVVEDADDPEPDRNRQRVQTLDAPLEVGTVADGIDVCEQRGERHETQALDPRLVHARGVVIAQESFDASTGPVSAT